jgi:hypothetical protein
MEGIFFILAKNILLIPWFYVMWFEGGKRR